MPKKYVSYSQYALWLKSKDLYRKRYYEGQPSIETKETVFGKRIAEMLEKGDAHPILSKAPRGAFSEFRIETEIAGVPTLSVLDSFSPNYCSCFENKTGKIPWTQDRVDSHEQLPFYAAAIRAKYGRYDPYMTLCWFETKQEPKRMEVGGEVMYSSDRDGEIELTGRMAVFTRFVPPAEVEKLEQKLRRVVEEIAVDWSWWQEVHKRI